MDRDSFPELEMLRAMQRRRHRKVVAGLVGGGSASVALGLAIFALAGGEAPTMGMGAVAVMLVGVGGLLVLRGLVSLFTDIDRKSMRAADDVAASDPSEEA